MRAGRLYRTINISFIINLNDCGVWEDTTTFYILHFCFVHMLIRVCAVFCVSFASSLTSALMKSHFLVDFFHHHTISPSIRRCTHYIRYHAC